MGRKKQEEPSHSESWLVSYCDMISLLCTFFLMMMTFSTKDKLDVKETGVGLLRGQGGIWQNMMSLPQRHEVEPSVVNSLARDLAVMSNKHADDPSASLEFLSDGFRIQFDIRSAFAPGSADVNDELRGNLLDVAGSLQRYSHLIVVEGHTDDRFKPTLEYPDAESLALARATAAARVMLTEAKLPPALVQVSGIGSTRPRASNDVARGRTANRRVEVHVLALAKPEAAPRESGPRPRER